MGSVILLDAYGVPYRGDIVCAPPSGPIIPPLPNMGQRSSDWAPFLHNLLGLRPKCEGCGRKAVTGHHVKPFHLFPELELVTSNIALVCMACHFVICHGGDWKLYIAGVRAALKRQLVTVLKAIRERKS